MKRMFIILLIFIMIAGCSKTKMSTCKINLKNNESNYELNAIYKIYHKDSFVTKIEKYEEYKSSNKDMINYFSEAKDIEYGVLDSKYGGYDYAVAKEKKVVKVNVTIDIEKTNIKLMVDDKYLSDYYVNKGKLSLGGIKYFYESKGAECDI